MSEHLSNAAVVLQAILNRRDPGHTYVVLVRERKMDESGCRLTPALWESDGGAVLQDPDPLRHRELLAAAGGADNHRSEQAT